MCAKNQSVVGSLPDPAAIHRELLDTLRHATTLRKLLRISQKQKKQLDQTPIKGEPDSEVRLAAS